MSFSEKIRDNLIGKPERRAAEFEGVWYSGKDFAFITAQLDSALKEAGVPAGAPVGVVARNRVFLAASLLGLIASERPVTMIYAFQSPEALADDIGNLRLAAIVAEDRDWTSLPIAAAKAAGTLGLSLTGDLARPVAAVPGLERMGAGPHRSPPEEPSIELLTSGTTGKPKRVPIKFAVLARAVSSGTLGDASVVEHPPQIVFWPFSGVGGICQLITAGALPQPMLLLEKFTVAGFVAAAKNHRPPLVSLTPSGARMIIEAKIPREDLSGVKMIFGGSGPLDADLQEQFEEIYGIPIYWGYGATEFCGTVVRWTPDMRKEFAVSKRGSIGRAMPDVDVRVVDPTTGVTRGPDEEGVLEARVPEIGPDWIRTTDLVTMDSDGFIFHRGRNDGAINRGGFKIMPEAVADVLRRHPSVSDAAVVGLTDMRLGQVPAAIVELRPGALQPTEAELDAHMRRHLPVTHIPARFMVVDALPRTPSMKVSLVEVRRLFESVTPAMAAS